MYDLLSENPGTTDNLVVVDDDGVAQVYVKIPHTARVAFVESGSQVFSVCML